MAGEIAQQLRVLAAQLEDWSLDHIKKKAMNSVYALNPSFKGSGDRRMAGPY